MAEYTISSKIEADTSKFKRQIEAAKRAAQKFKPAIDAIKNNKIDADSSGVTKAVESAKKSVESFEKMDKEADLDADIS